MTNGKSVIIIDYNEKSGKVVRVASPYSNHQSMLHKDFIERLTTLVTAGWKEIERRTWNELCV
jgi:hypothetical protein